MSELNELWCVGIRPEGDSPHEQEPAISKEIAERGLERIRKMIEAEGNRLLIENFDDYCQVQKWEGTAEEHAANMYYTEDWFNEPIYQCKNMEQAEIAFQFGEIVHCLRSDGAEIVTADFEEAKQFYLEPAIHDVLAERKRQIEKEHYSSEHDDDYKENELPRAAVSYAGHVIARQWTFKDSAPETYQSEEAPDLWPWDLDFWKPKTPRKDLVRAAALLLAEIDRMDRSAGIKK